MGTERIGLDEDPSLIRWNRSSRNVNGCFSALLTAHAEDLSPVCSTLPIVCSTCSIGISMIAARGPHAAVIERLYRDMDRLVGETLKYVDEKTAVFVLSDHGFCSFRRGVNLNSWLQQNGYLALHDDASEERKVLRRCGLEPHTRVRHGTGGTLPQLRGRESGGTVSEAEAAL